MPSETPGADWLTPELMRATAETLVSNARFSSSTMVVVTGEIANAYLGTPALAARIAELEALANSQAERIAGQSELLSKRSESPTGWPPDVVDWDKLKRRIARHREWAQSTPRVTRLAYLSLIGDAELMMTRIAELEGQYAELRDTTWNHPGQSMSFTSESHASTVSQAKDQALAFEHSAAHEAKDKRIAELEAQVKNQQIVIDEQFEGAG